MHLGKAEEVERKRIERARLEPRTTVLFYEEHVVLQKKYNKKKKNLKVSDHLSRSFFRSIQFRNRSE